MSNERQTHGRRPYQISNYGPSKFIQPKPPLNENTLKSEEIQIERKNFLFALKENPRGKFLRITEDVGGRRDTIIVPAGGLTEFKKIVDEMASAAEKIPAKSDA